ncbi:MAG: ABC transporter substrate-binding protein [Anaerolineae bacterium]|nr:ABC transporter substrate-binding protein [Anaerolineae bacterium]
MNRREFLKLTAAGAASLALAGCGSSSAVNPAPASQTAGSGHLIRIGFIPLTDCASVVMADKLGLYKQYGLNVEVSKEASWANIRDKLLVGELQAAHCLFGMPFSVYTGVGGTAGKELKIAMMLNANGQGITLAKELAQHVGYGQVDGLAEAVEALRAKKEPTFAMTFPGGTHDMWLRYWLAAGGVDQNSVKIVTIPPPQMVANMKVNTMDGYCVGEPWNGVAVKDDIGYTAIATQDIWQDHPEKALVVNPEFAAKRRDDLKKVMRAVLEASIWLDKIENRAEAAEVISGQAYVNAPADVLAGRLTGKYDLGAGLGEKVFSDEYMLFHKEGAVNFPRKSHAIWYMSQYVRFGYLKETPDYKAIADKLIMQDLYQEAASELKIALPGDDMQSFTVKLDNTTFDPVNPKIA